MDWVTELSQNNSTCECNVSNKENDWKCKLLEISPWLLFLTLHKEIRAVMIYYIKQNDFSYDT